MFPRPSRLLRLIFFLSFIILITVSMYVLNPDFNSSSGSSSNGIDFKLKQKMSTPWTVPSPSLPANENSNNGHQQAVSILQLQQQRVTSAKPDQVADNEYKTDFPEGVVRKFQKSRTLALKFDTEPAVDFVRAGSTKMENPHNFDYIHNPSKLCHRTHVGFLVYIHSSPVNLKKRQAVRQTWGHPKVLSLYNATLVFILGSVSDKSVQSLVDMESSQYGDIVQEDFIDSYRNLTHKGVAGLKWAATFCPTAEFLLKTDDDILLDIVTLMDNLYTKVLPTRQSRTKLVLCNLWTRMKVIRDTKSKWYISKEEFVDEYFPAYCSGSAFLLSADMVPALYKTALHTPFFWVDDYYITGMLVNKIEVKHTRFNSAYLLNYNVAEEKLQNDTKELLIFHVKKLSLFLKLWPILMQRHKGMEEYLQAIKIPVQNHSNHSHHHEEDASFNKSDNDVIIEEGRYEESANDIPRVKNTSRSSLVSSRRTQMRAG